MLTDAGLWLLSKIAVPLADRIWDGASRQAPEGIQRLKRFVRRKTLELTTSDDERFVVGLFQGRQWDYQSLLKKCEGRLDSETLLPILTSLQTKGLVNKPRIEQPPHPRAMFTVTNDAALLLPVQQSKVTKRRARRRDIDEAVRRRARLADLVQLQQEYDQLIRRASFIPEQASMDAEERQKRIEADRDWLAKHGF